ncbi:DUF1840 domain-containing protein [Legionella sp. km772]|uniref:DUF1840 domain-containing protein n=1 Tax=Legionella sp. km772 TaxID=2498111 RepID=UPI000F8F242D|nr:DUF1840 domain-containing protein [Legionella sp. km772]RUR11914.1 DUF1840 domain-containing protein [Legionella sp. km772]
MFVTFTSEAYENITYFHSVAKQLILLMEHSGAIPGAIKAADLPHALANLKHGLPHQDVAAPADEDDEPEISLAKRAVPLIQLLEASIKKNCDVVWSEDKASGYN